MTDVPKKRWGPEQRLEFIDFVAYWEGAINRAHLIEQFGVSAPLASSDLTTYQQLAPDNLRYDLSSKRYVTTSSFRCALLEPDADRYLKQLTALATNTVGKTDTWIGYVPAVDIIPIPARRVDAEVMRGLLRAVRCGQSVEIEYQSMSSDAQEFAWRRITPHAFGSDGLRWHVRAYCHRSERFKDFLLSRCRGTRDFGEPGATPDSDERWNRYFSVELIANPALSPSQRKAIEFDYAMIDGKAVLSVRYALLYYFEKRFRSDIAVKQAYGSMGDPRENPIVVANQEQYIEALISVGVRPSSGVT
jgi:hypothetical protein